MARVRRRCKSCAKKRKNEKKSPCCSERMRRIIVSVSGGRRGIRMVCTKCGRVAKDV